MAEVVETIERDGVKVLVYDNGMERNAATGRLLRGPTQTLITPENTTVYHRARQELKRSTIAAAANEAVENGKIKATYGDMAFVAAIAETAMIKATTPEDPKAVDAMRFLLQETGIAEAQRVGEVGNTGAVLAAAINAETAAIMSQLWADIQAAQARLADGTIQDGEVIVTRNENDDNDE